MSDDKAGLGEQALSKAAEIGISSQLDEVENLEVDIRTDPFKAIQGEVESVTIQGEGLVMENDLRMEEMTLKTGAVAINPLSAAFGKIELTRPTEAEAHVVLTEEDINRAFNSDFIREKLQNLSLQVEGQPMTVDTQKVDFQLPGDGKISLSADVLLREAKESKRVSFKATPVIAANGQTVALENVEYIEGQDISPELTDALLSKSSELLDLRNFELEGMDLKVQHLDAQAGNLVLQAKAYVEEFPS